MATQISRGTTVATAAQIGAWASTANAIDGSPPTAGTTYCTLTQAANTGNNNATATITISGYTFGLSSSTGLTVDTSTANLTMAIRHYESSTTYVGSVTVQLQDSAGASIGTAVTVTKTNAAAIYSAHPTAVPTAQNLVDGLRCFTVVTHNNSSRAATFYLDEVDITVTYTQTETGTVAATLAKASAALSGEVSAAAGSVNSALQKATAALSGTVTAPPNPVFASIGTECVTGESVTTVNVPVPSGVSTGDAILVCMYVDTDGTPTLGTLPTGFTQAPASPETMGGLRMYVFTKTATGSDAGTYDFPFTTNPINRGRAFAVRFTGAEGSNTFLDVDVSEQSNGTAYPDTSLVTNGTNELLVWYGCGYEGTPYVTTPPAGRN